MKSTTLLFVLFAIASAARSFKLDELLHDADSNLEEREARQATDPPTDTTTDPATNDPVTDDPTGTTTTAPDDSTTASPGGSSTAAPGKKRFIIRNMKFKNLRIKIRRRGGGGNNNAGQNNNNGGRRLVRLIPVRRQRVRIVPVNNNRRRVLIRVI
ncbi:unnamed protein product [Hermetia illucens]|uniref:Uncharacterized protein n=1 Tax=Hermetia illucens TaxID=343691 RepID=A0A7R8UXL8_HERIL|nr:unnamed protein product [Hermetia illucens]